MSLLKTSSKIRIVGGGIGGLALALSLQRSRFTNVRVYEKDVQFDSRRQGYALTINASATAYLVDLGILDEVRKFNQASHSHMSFNARTGEVIGYFGNFLHPDVNKNNFNMHLSRQVFRKILYDAAKGLNEDTVVWNKRLIALSEDNHIDSSHVEGSKTLSIEFSDGSREEGIEMLVGADGIYSTVKQQVLPELQLNYLGVLIVLGITNVPSFKNKTFQMVEGGVRLYCMPFDEGRVMWQMSFLIDEAAGSALKQSPAMLKAELLRRCGHWVDPIPYMISSTDESLVMGCLGYDTNEDEVPSLGTASPILKNDRVILLGDSVHPMCPFKGQGANQALRDGAMLGSQLKHAIKLPDAVATFRAEMHARALKKVRDSRDKIAMLHSDEEFSRTFLRVSRAQKEFVAHLRDRGVGFHQVGEIETAILRELAVYNNSGCENLG